jgi:hypothetical protein
MATLKDAKALQKQVYDLANAGKLVGLRALLWAHPEVDLERHTDDCGRTALYRACFEGHTECVRLLIDYKANVNAKMNCGHSALHAASSNGCLIPVKLLVQNGAEVNRQDGIGQSPLMGSTDWGHLTVAQYLLEHKADVHYRMSNDHHVYRANKDVLYGAMREYAIKRTPGVAFAILSCNTDAKNVLIDTDLSGEERDAHIETYKHVQAFIDEYHRILNLVLSEHVPVDPRFGLGQMGIYQEPLERTLEYLGLSMSKDQVVNASIDGEKGVERALIPGHLINANHWFDKYEDR